MLGLVLFFRGLSFEQAGCPREKSDRRKRSMFRPALSVWLCAYLTMPVAVVWCGAPLNAGEPFQARDVDANRSPAAARGPSTGSRATSAPKPSHAAASSLFQRHCARCHGSNGTGSDRRERWRNLPDFTRSTWHETRTPQELLVSIRDGKGLSMPPFGDRLRGKELDEIVSLVRSFASLPPESVRVLPADFEKRFQELRRDWDDLRSEFQKLSSQFSDD